MCIMCVLWDECLSTHWFTVKGHAPLSFALCLFLCSPNPVLTLIICFIPSFPLWVRSGIIKPDLLLAILKLNTFTFLKCFMTFQTFQNPKTECFALRHICYITISIFSCLPLETHLENELSTLYETDYFAQIYIKLMKMSFCISLRDQMWQPAVRVL